MSSLRKTSSTSTADGAEKLRRGPWTLEEDSLLTHYISHHGEGRWNSLAKHAGLRRTGKSCRLRWLNYLKPDVKRGNLTPEEQFLILELHSKLGNRWSKIAQQLPGRTDNEIKNYWRTRVQKQARHLKIDANSTAFENVIRCFWMPRLLQKMDGSSPFSSEYSTVPQSQALMRPDDDDHQHHVEQNTDSENCGNSCVSSSIESVNNNITEISRFAEYQTTTYHIFGNDDCNSDTPAKDCYGYVDNYASCYDVETADLASTSALADCFPNWVGDCHLIDNYWVNEGFADGLWSMGF